MIGKAEKTFSFGDFELDGTRRLLLKKGEPLSLNSKTLDLLLVLAENRGRLLSKDELLETVWEDQFVEENNLSVHISALRKIFDEKKDAHQFIVTIPGKGYKFIAGETSLTKTGQASNLLSSGVSGEIIGRAEEIADIKRILRERNKCLLTLTGAGGSGKTTLAKAIAGECREEFEDGVFFIELAAIDRAEYLAAAIAQAFDLKGSGDRSPLDALKEFFRKRSILLVLDNFEQLLSAAPLVKELLDSASNLKILVTSRAALRLKAEQEKVVLPLAVPPQNSNLSAEQLSGYAAIKLFAVRAREIKPAFVLTEENAPVIAQICDRLDGLPLAIELAAARVKLLSPQAILERLENSLKLLTGGAGDLPRRQRTMRDTIRWSYDLLAEDEKNLFSRLAVFAGGFTVEAAEAVCEECETGSRPGTEVLDSLSALVDSNLLVSKEQADGNARLWMLEVVREFALEQFQKLDDRDTLRQMHTRYFLVLAEKAETFLQGEAGNEWLEKLESEHDNLRAALEWSLTNEPQTAARIAAALRFFWLNHSHLGEGLRWSKAALQTTENSPSEPRSKLLMSNGLFLKNHGDLEAARKSYEKCSAESKETNDLVHIVKADHGLAAVAVLQGDFAAAQEFLTEALALSREMGDDLQTAHSLGSFGDLEMCRGDLSSARPLLEECLALSKKVGSEGILTTIYFNLGTIDYLEDLYESAADNFALSLRIAERMGHKTMISCALDGFAALAAVFGDFERSTRLAGAAEALREEIGCQLEPAEESFRETYLAKSRLALTEKESTLLYAQGRAMNLEDAVTLAKRVMNEEEGQVIEEIITEKHSFSRVVIEETIVEKRK